MNRPTSITAILPDVAKRYGIGKDLDATHLLARYDSLISALIPAKTPVSRGAFIKGDLLFVYVRSSAAAQEVMMHKRHILDVLNGLDSSIRLRTIITKLQKSLQKGL